MVKSQKISIYGLKKTIAIPSETSDAEFLESGSRVSNLQLEAIDPKLEARLLKTDSVELLQTLTGLHDVQTLDLVDRPIKEDIEVEIIEEESPEVGIVKKQIVKKAVKKDSKSEKVEIPVEEA